MGNFQPVEVGEELTVSSSQPKDCDLSCSVQLVDAVPFRPNVWAYTQFKRFSTNLCVVFKSLQHSLDLYKQKHTQLTTDDDIF